MRRSNLDYDKPYDPGQNISLKKGDTITLPPCSPENLFDDNGNIGKRYRRQDEIGTPFCVVIDFETVEQGTGVTIRDRDTGEQKRMQISELVTYIEEKVS